jgi:hypothetical protein
VSAEIKYERLQQEMIKKGTYKKASPKSIEDFIGRSEQYIKKTYQKYFPDFSDDGIKSSYDQPLIQMVNDIFKNTKLNPKAKFEMSTLSLVEDRFLDYSAGDLIVGLSQKQFSKSQIAKVLLAHVIKKIDKMNGIAEDTEINLSDVDYSALQPADKFGNIVKEIQTHGLNPVDLYYQTAQEIHSQQVDIVFQNGKAYVKRFEKNKVIAEKVERDVARKFFGIDSKEYNYDLKRSEEFKFAFDDGLKYLRECYESETQPAAFVRAAENLTTLWKDIRDNIPGVVSSHISAFTFWGRQLGREPSDEDLKRLGVSRKKYEAITKHVFDERLRYSEASAFSLIRRGKTPENYRKHPELALLNTVKALLESHRETLGETKEVNVMVLVNDNSYLKIKIPLDATDEKIEELLGGKPTQIELNQEQRYLLKLDAFKSPPNRSQTYQDIYGFPDTKTGYGDYIVRLTTYQPKNAVVRDNNSVFSMHTVGSYQALVDLNLNVPEGMEMSMRAAHHYFDGVALVPLFGKIYDRVVDRQNDNITVPMPDLITRAGVTEVDLTQDYYPLMQATATSVIEDPYEATEMTHKQEHLLPTPVIRTMALAFANGVFDMHLLYNSKNNPYSDRRWDNVQSVVISMHPIKDIIFKFHDAYYDQRRGGSSMPTITEGERKRVLRWIERTNDAIKLAKWGFSTVAVLSAPFGTFRKLATNVSTRVYENVKFLNQSSGMNSFMVGNDEFETAEADAFNPPIDLKHYKRHLGVIGTTANRVGRGKEDRAIYKVKKTPNQAQAAFMEKLVLNNELGLSVERRNNVRDVIDKVLKEWDKMILHNKRYADGNIVRKMFNKDYESVLRDAVKVLRRDQYLGIANMHRLGITDYKSLQRKLNEILIQDAKDTVNQHEISYTTGVIYEFLRAVKAAPNGQPQPVAA